MSFRSGSRGSAASVVRCRCDHRLWSYYIARSRLYGACSLWRGATALSEIVVDVVSLSGERASARDASEREHAPGDSSSVARSFAADEGGRVRACPFHFCETTAVSASPSAGNCAMIYKERWSQSCPDSDSELDEAEDGCVVSTS